MLTGKLIVFMHFTFFNHNYYHGSSHCLAPAGIPCVHTCAALSCVNKQPKDFCHRWLTMDSYKETYNHHINPIPGQPMWEKAADCNRPHAPKIKTKPGKLKMKRRMDADEKSDFETKKPKVDPKLSGNTADGVHLKRQLGSCTKKPSKLSPRRRSSNKPTAPTVNPLQGASSATSSKFANLMQFIPTPGFKLPRKKN
ncbi:hypothetical protein Ahy_A05g024937 [Arachis hypogaea]|uniref:SWIM-type domain-containing protein n=1 Tax=Arachis hypogaea TaxID=3818 RepID=A0A445D785_ARAHY|nr:hypothetical protein Ahy_A05g024937 [Arachis hypogaea]